MNSSINRFGALAGLVKKVKRSGWLRYLPSEKVESVGDHSAKIAFLTLYLRNLQNVDYLKCLQMALIHDIAEGLVGDYTPYDKISPQLKHEQESLAMNQILQELGQDNKLFFRDLWLEYEAGESYQAQIVKDLDKLQMIQQAFQYQKSNGVDLKQFYLCVQKMKTPLVKEWANELLIERDNIIKKGDFSNNNIKGS